MADSPTQEQVLDAARSLDEGFTRDQVAEKLGVERQKMRQSWRAAKQAGQLEKVGENAEGTNIFKVT
jgi:hypothetical protein